LPKGGVKGADDKGRKTMRAAIVGAGPAGLMAAERLAQAGLSVTVFEAKASPGRKFLMAGKSGLNLTFEGDRETCLAGYGTRADVLRSALEAFNNRALRAWADELGAETFAGPTGRVFPKALKASPLLRAWLGRLAASGVEVRRNWRWTGWDGEALCFATPAGRQSIAADVIVLACGGASWSRLGSDGAWAAWLGAPVSPFEPANAAVRIAWTPHMQRHFGRPLKAVRWSCGDLWSRGEGVITADGLEGGGLYALTPGLRDGAPLWVDLVPDVPQTTAHARLRARPKSVTRGSWLQRRLKLSPEKNAVLMESVSRDRPPDEAAWAARLKATPLAVLGLADMDDAISTAGGVRFEALTPSLMLRARPGVFCAGEMLDWEAPTGGWLLTACFATGAWAGDAAARYVRA